MNYLAHAYLSFGQPEVLVGNMISDFVKGKKKYEYSAAIQKGIALHRSIDDFTDNHQATKAARKIFQPHYGLYSAVFMDVVYDHFLAIDATQFTERSLLQFSLETYKILDDYKSVFPPRFAMLYPYMKEFNWLYNYRTFEGIGRSFEGISHRAMYMSESNTAFLLFKENYNELQIYYNVFFDSLKVFAFDTLKTLNDT